MDDINAAIAAAIALIRATVEDDRPVIDALATGCDATTAKILARIAATLIVTRRGATPESVAGLLDRLTDEVRRMMAAGG